MTILDALIQALDRAAEFNRDDQAAPAAILWPDRERQWEPLLPVLRVRLPQLLALGAYNPAHRTGPGVWLRCMLAGGLPEASWPVKTTPILYLPGVSRQELRAVADSPPALMPLAELQFRGVFWSQANHKDWTVPAFLQSNDGGLGLDVSRDAGTLDALKSVLVKLVETEVQDLAGHRLEASDFHALLSPDPVREILAWLNDPKTAQGRMSPEHWDAFCHACKDKFGFQPSRDGPLRAAEMLGGRQGNWSQVWDRFREAPRRHPNLAGWLRKARPQEDELFLKDGDEVWPQSNELSETALRQALKGCAGKPSPPVLGRIKELESIHGPRRSWVWADLGLAPLAVAMKHLATMGETCASPVAGGSLDDLRTAYTSGGWRADSAVADALSVVEKPDDVSAVESVIRAVYLPWLESQARAFQKLALTDPEGIRPKPPASVSELSPGTVILFADGLRFDLAQKLKARLAERGLEAHLQTRWTALPSVTPTAKPAASPITSLLAGADACVDFKPRIKDGGKELTSERFRQLLESHGCQVLGAKTTGQPDCVGWIECGGIDATGHNEGWKLAKRLAAEVDGLAETIAVLLGAGWKKVKVVRPWVAAHAGRSAEG